LIFALPLTAQKIVEWIVLDEETRSDHKYVFFRIGLNAERRGNDSIAWCRKKLDPKKLKEYLDGKDLPRNLMENIWGACDTVMSRTKPTYSYHKPQYW